MDLSTLFLIGCLLFLFLVLFWSFYSSSERPFSFYGESSGWSKLNEEHTGILSKSKNLSRIPLEAKKCSSHLSYSSPSDDFIKMGYGIALENEEEPVIEEKKQYLVPTEEIQHQLHVETQPDVHCTPVREKENEIEEEPSSLRRAISTDSLDSTTSSVMGTGPDVPTAHLIVNYHEPSQMLSVQVERVTDACGDYGHIWMLFFLLPHPKPLWRTEARVTPASVITYNCIFQQCIKKSDLNKIALLIQLYSSRNQNASISGQCRLRLKDLNISMAGRDIPVAMSLQPSRSRTSVDDGSLEKLGDVLFMMTYNKDTLTVVVSKIRGLTDQHKRGFVRLYLVLPMGKSVKKKTSERVLENGGAEISESMFFNVPNRHIQQATLRLSVVCDDGEGRGRSIGHVTIGPKTSGKELGHWTRAISGESNLASWHSIQPRQTKLQ